MKPTLFLCVLAFSTAIGAAAQPTTFTGDFESGDLSQWAGKEAARADSVQVVTAPARSGRFAAKFTVREGERVSNGNRAELTHDNGDLAGSEAWYAWSFLIPDDFEDVEWKPKMWQCLGQWHDQPDTARGETWATFPGRSPSIAVYYTSKNGVPTIELWYGTYEKGQRQKIAATSPIVKGQWQDLTFRIRWSQGNDGFLEPFLNGKPLVAPQGDNHRVYGPNMWNRVSHYLKIGLYRSDNISSTNSVFFDEVRIGDTPAKVALPPREEARR